MRAKMRNNKVAFYIHLPSKKELLSSNCGDSKRDSVRTYNRGPDTVQKRKELLFQITVGET